MLGFATTISMARDVDLLAALHENGRVHQRRYARAVRSPAQGQSDLHSRAIYLEFYLSRRPRAFTAPICAASIRTASVDLGLAAYAAAGASRRARSRRARDVAAKNFTLTFALYNLWQQSETIIDPDVGQDTAGSAQRTLRLRNQRRPMQINQYGSNSTAASRPTTRASPSPSTTGRATSANTSPMRPSPPALSPSICTTSAPGAAA